MEMLQCFLKLLQYHVPKPVSGPKSRVGQNTLPRAEGHCELCCKGCQCREELLVPPIYHATQKRAELGLHDQDSDWTELEVTVITAALCPGSCMASHLHSSLGNFSILPSTECCRSCLCPSGVPFLDRHHPCFSWLPMSGTITAAPVLTFPGQTRNRFIPASGVVLLCRES